MTDEVSTEGFTRRYVGNRGEFLLRVNEQAGEMAFRVGRRRAYQLEAMEGCRAGTAAHRLELVA